MNASRTHNPIFVAIDTADLDAAASLAERVRASVGGVKLGLEFFAAHGPAGVLHVAGLGLPVFLDLKLHDIPNTVAGAVRAALPMRPALLTIHAGGGPAMIAAAAEAATESGAEPGADRPKIVVVTVLTSLDADDLRAVGQDTVAEDQVKRLAALAQTSGADGVVCSPREVALLRAQCGQDFMLVVPGIRPADAATDDQKRVMTPAEAVSAGADILVIGRPITRAPDPGAAARHISERLP